MAIYNAIDRNLLRIARGINWDRSHLPTVEWTSDAALLSLQAAWRRAWARPTTRYVFINCTSRSSWRRRWLPVDGVIEALETGYAALREGPARLGSAANFLNDVRQNLLGSRRRRFSASSRSRARRNPHVHDAGRFERGLVGAGRDVRIC